MHTLTKSLSWKLTRWQCSVSSARAGNCPQCSRAPRTSPAPGGSPGWRPWPRTPGPRTRHTPRPPAEQPALCRFLISVLSLMIWHIFILTFYLRLVEEGQRLGILGTLLDMKILFFWWCKLFIFLTINLSSLQAHCRKGKTENQRKYRNLCKKT